MSDKNINSRGLENQIRWKVSTSSELKAVGYVFLKSQRTAEAIRLFPLNVHLFPEEGNTHDSLAEGFIEAGNN